MKNYFIGCLVMLALACHKEDLVQEKPSGILKLKIGLYLSVTEEDQRLKSTLGTEDFKVIIYNSSGQEIHVYEKASDIPDEVRLETGTYYVTASSDNDLPAAFNNPWYFGRSDDFSIAPGGSQSVVVTCEMANTMVTVVYGENVKNFFSDYHAMVSSATGSLLYDKEETRAGYFHTMPLTVEASLTWQKQDGTSTNKTITGTIPDPQPCRKYEVHVQASAIEGMSMIVVNLGDTVVPVEIVNVSEEPGIDDGILHAGDLLITEIMYDPSAITDTYGEWIEIYNNTAHTINLKNIVLTKNETDKHVISGDLPLASHGYQVLARTETAFAGSMYVYGTSITLNNTGARLALSTYGTNGSDGAEICAVDYGAENFPVTSGASISLSPAHLNATDAAQGASWCEAVTAFSTGDLGTPGAVNDTCSE